MMMSLVSWTAACALIQPPGSNPPLAVSTAAVQPLASPLPVLTATPASAPAARVASPAPAQPAKVLVSFSGADSAVSDTFHLSADGAVKVSWRYTGLGHFAAWLVNVSEELSDPTYDRQLVVDVNAEAAGAASFRLIAGDYTLEVEEAAGPWTVAVEPQP